MIDQSIYFLFPLQIAQGDSQSWAIRLKDWFFDYWNQVDLLTLILFATGFVLRFFEPTLEAARVILALDLFVFFLRLLNIFTLYRNIGPKLVMIARMVGFFTSYKVTKFNSDLLVLQKKTQQTGYPFLIDTLNRKIFFKTQSGEIIILKYFSNNNLLQISDMVLRGVNHMYV